MRRPVRKKKLKTLRVGETGTETNIPLNTAHIRKIALCEKADRSCGTYIDDKAEAYTLSTGTLLKTYAELPFELRNARCIEDNTVLLPGTSAACVTDKSGKPIALLGGLCVALPKSGIYLTAGNGTLLLFLVCSDAMLREEAEALLNIKEPCARLCGGIATNG